MKPTPDMINLALSFLADVVLDEGLLLDVKSGQFVSLADAVAAQIPLTGIGGAMPQMQITIRVLPAAGRAPKHERLEAAGLKLLARAKEIELDAAQRKHP